jgi:predicted Zn finger-like uncharacterized protein
MKITCRKCNAVYTIDASKIPAGGAPATCKRCGNKFRVQPPSKPPAMPGIAPPPLPENTTDTLPEPPVPAPVSIETKEKEKGLKPLSGLTKAVRLLLILEIVLLMIAVLAGCYEYYIYENLPIGTNINDVLLPSDAVVGIVGIAQLVLFCILGITFLRWIYRANKNLREMSGQTMYFTPGWAVGWYFVPIANLFKPFQAMKEIWEVSHKRQDNGAALLGVWWALWLISNLLGEHAFGSVIGAESVAEHTMKTMIYLVSDGLDIVLDIVAFALVTRIGAAYSRNYREHRKAIKWAPMVSGSPEDTEKLIEEGSVASDLHSTLL